MVRSSHGAWKASALAAAFLALATWCGCQPAKNAEPRKTKDSGATAKADSPSGTATGAKLTGRQVLRHMVDAYRKATTYSDMGVVRLLAESNGEKVEDQTIPFAVALERPNKLRVDAYQVMLVCDGKEVHAALQTIPNQVLVRPAPDKVTMKILHIDPSVAMGVADFAGPPPQLLMLLSADPLKDILRGADEPVLEESGQIDNGRDCYRVRIDRPEGTMVFWIDQESLVLRRIVLPTEGVRAMLPQDKPIDRVSLTADFVGAHFGGTVDPKAFQFEMPPKARQVSLLVPPHMGQLLGKRVPSFKFTTLDDKPVSPESLRGKVAVLDLWATWCGPCHDTLPELDKVYQRYKNNPKVVFLAVSIDDPRMKDAEIVAAAKEMKLSMPIARDAAQALAAFNAPGVPVRLLVDAKGIVQDYDVESDPRDAAVSLPGKIDKVLAGEDVYGPLLKKYNDLLEQLKRDAKKLETMGEDFLSQTGETVTQSEELPEAKIAAHSEPAHLKLTKLWKCSDLRSPGNVVVLADKSGPARLAVVDDWSSVAEVGLDGKLIARHKLTLGDKEFVARLRVGAGADGHRYVVAFLMTHQRCHVLDENWRQVADYPEDALKNPHSGISDVELGDLDGDGRLKMYVGYLGVVGVQAVPVPPQGNKRLWSNRSLSNVGGMALGGADQQGRRLLYCPVNDGSLAILDAAGQVVKNVTVRNRTLGWIASADLRGDGKPMFCGLAAAKTGENVAVGVSPTGQELWNYPMPIGLPQSPVELIVPGRVTRDGPGQWLLPGPDGSIHILAADGRPFDKFNYGASLQGLATVEIGGRPALVVSSSNGLEAWQVD